MESSPSLDKIGSSSEKAEISHSERRSPNKNGPADYSEAWNKAENSGPPESDRLMNLMGVAATMSRSGHAEDAIAKIVGSFGPGESRCLLIRQVFMQANLPENMAEIFKTLEFDDEKNAACMGLANNLSEQGSPDKIDTSKYDYLGDRKSDLLATIVERYVTNNSASDPDVLSKEFRTAFGADMTLEAEKMALSKLFAIAPFDCWDHLTERGMDTLNVDARKLIYEMIYQDPQKTISKLSDNSKADNLLSPAFSLWMENDALKPITWLKENSQSLSAGQKDRAYQGVANYAAQQKDYEVAKQWANQVEDVKIREEILQDLTERCRLKPALHLR